MYSIFPKENVFQSTKVYLKRNEFTSSPKENEFQNWIHPGYKGFPQIKCIPQNRMYSKYKAFLESKCIRVQEFSSKENVFGVQEFSLKENVFTEEDMASLPSLKMAPFLLRMKRSCQPAAKSLNLFKNTQNILKNMKMQIQIQIWLKK